MPEVGAGDADGARDEDVYGLLVLGGTAVALPLSALREVVPCPAELTALPVSAVGLVGAMELRELVVPVLDLQVAFTGAPGGAADQRVRGAGEVVVVVTDGDQLIGVIADEVRGVVHVPASGLLAVRAGGGALLVSHTFRHPDGTGIVSVLDAAAILSLPGVPTVRDAHRETAAVGPAAAAGRAAAALARRTLTLLRCGEHVLALDVAHVHTTLPGSAPTASVLDSALCRGVTTYVDAEVAVVDPLVLLGLGALDEQQARGAGLVVDLDGGYVVLALTGLLDIVEVDREQILPVPGFAVPRPDLLAGVVDLPGTGQCLVLDGAALGAEEELRVLGSLNTRTAPASGTPAPGTPAPGTPAPGTAASDGATGDGASDAGRPYITYTAGTDVATPLDQVAEILPLPTTHTRTTGGAPGGWTGGAVTGVLAHRGAAVPVLHLPTLLGLAGAPTTAASCLLLVDVDGAPVGFAVDGLRAIEPLVWQDPEGPQGQGDDAPGPGRVLAASPLVQVGQRQELLRGVDLLALARAVRDGSTASAPSQQPQAA